MNPLNERLDDVGWTNTDDSTYTRRVFQWMQQATAEIDRLTAQVERLQEEVKPG